MTRGREESKISNNERHHLWMAPYYFFHFSRTLCEDESMETDEIKTCEKNDEELNESEDQENLEEGEALDYTNRINPFHEKNGK